VDVVSVLLLALIAVGVALIAAGLITAEAIAAHPPQRRELPGM
jgi:hypothetical protein